MENDVQRWDKKYRQAALAPILQIDPLLESHVVLPTGQKKALDLAAGTCHTSVYLAKQGFDATALDCSAVGLALGQKLAKREGVKIKIREMDLDRVMLPAGPWAIISCFRYLNRALFLSMIEALAPGGLLFVKTFNVHHLVKAPAFNPEYVLQPGELASAFSMLEMIALSDGDNSNETSSWIVARRPSG